MHVCACIHRCMSPSQCVGMFTCGVQSVMSGLCGSPPCLLRQGLSLNSELSNLTRLASHLEPGFCLSPSTKCWSYRHAPSHWKHSLGQVLCKG